MALIPTIIVKKSRLILQHFVVEQNTLAFHKLFLFFSTSIADTKSKLGIGANAVR